MPTERFMRLPKEKIEAIRIAAAKEFMRVPPEEVSINRIIRDANISRGSFYTYFDDKEDLLKWLVYAHAEKHFMGYVDALQTNGGDLWDMLENVFDKGMSGLEESGLLDIFHNLVKSAKIVELFKCDPDEDPRIAEGNKEFLNRIYDNIDHEKHPLDKDAVFDLLEMQMMVFLMSMKKYFRDGAARETASEYYRSHIRMLHYGVYEYKTDHSKE